MSYRHGPAVRGKAQTAERKVCRRRDDFFPLQVPDREGMLRSVGARDKVMAIRAELRMKKRKFESGQARQLPIIVGPAHAKIPLAVTHCVTLIACVITELEFTIAKLPQFLDRPQIHQCHTSN